MSGTACLCPDASLDAVHPIPTDVIRCGCCGSPVRLTCDGECGEQHIRATFTNKPVPWVCPRCNRPIPRKRGRAPKCCDDCRTPAEMAHIEEMRAYNERKRKESQR